MSMFQNLQASSKVNSIHLQSKPFFPKVNLEFPKVNLEFPKVNLKIFWEIFMVFRCFQMLETTFPLTSAVFSDVVRMWFGRGSDLVRMWVRGGSDVFSDLVQTVWQKSRESGFQHFQN